ncbi:TetR/AcrR family transcriptional regulator [Sorangium sp. So ce131]|uniref:TetR/AcrR family transcriptional regulator n=1 Tax=Sorangium sp. So ce131 TaxID=3133282 RepID=UPI003F645A6B
MNAERSTRRTEGLHTRGRAARVVSDVLRATAEELGRVGYAALRVEEVAVRSGVNKTTIYRRWPTKSALVAAALRQITDEQAPPDTGTLRGDLLEHIQRMSEWASSPIGRGVTRMMLRERAEQEVEEIARSLRTANYARRMEPIRRGITRGELPEGTSAELVVELVYSPIVTFLMLTHEPLTEEHAAAIVDVVLAGARTGAAIRNLRIYPKDEEGG